MKKSIENLQASLSTLNTTKKGLEETLDTENLGVEERQLIEEQLTIINKEMQSVMDRLVHENRSLEKKMNDILGDYEQRPKSLQSRFTSQMKEAVKPPNRSRP